MSLTRLMLVDDHEVVAQALICMLRADDQFRDAVVATSGAEAIALARSFLPEIVVMDVRLPGRSGFEIASEIQNRVPGVRILFISGDAPLLHVNLAVRMKAGMILKGCSTSFLLESLRRVAKGELVYSPEIALAEPASPQSSLGSSTQKSQLSVLTARQIEVLRHLASGASMKETAALMHLSVKTIDNHTTRIMKTLGVHSRVELVHLAIRESLVLL